ncbi:MAG: hypothetical protein PF481_10105 [Bacteroidales bacterium]|jgi:hypothetical protein|nr:hypothetical protein [Bacteroidales bacterium]
MKNNKIDLFSGKPIIENDDKKYADMIAHLKGAFGNEFPKKKDESERINLILSAWNIACLDHLLPEEGRMDLFGLSEYTKNEKTLLKKIVDLKHKEFAEFTRLINDFTLEKKDGGFELAVITTDIEDFVRDFVENEDFDEDLDDLQFNEGFINRNAIVLTPRKPFWEWARTFSPYYSDSEERNKSNMYLIDEDVDDCEKWLQKQFDTFFTIELEDWHTTKKNWPKKRSYKMFKEWFTINFSNMVYDMKKRPVIKEW